eukprot:9778566-Lingulodinium_polyedra.AAC.1
MDGGCKQTNPGGARHKRWPTYDCALALGAAAQRNVARCGPGRGARRRHLLALLRSDARVAATIRGGRRP